MAKKILINYANKTFKEAQKLNTKTGMEIGNFDRVIEYSPEDIDKSFYEKNKKILDQPRGAGFWLWKPYIILKTLKRKDVKNGDIIFYADSGSHFIDKIDPIIKLSKKYKQDIIPFADYGSDIEKTRTKRDAFILMNLDSKKYTDTTQRGPGFILFKKSKFSIKFFKEFLNYAQDERIITDAPSKLGPDYPGFIENRHDQSIFSLLSKKYNLKVFRHTFVPDREGENTFTDRYPQIVVLTRKNNRTLLEKIRYQKTCSRNNEEFIKNLLKMPYGYVLNKLKKIK
jgi:hypothetical protein